MRKIFGVSGWWYAGLSVLFLFGAHLADGANTSALAMGFSVLTLVLCLIGLALIPQSLWVLTEPSLKWIAALFVLTLIYVGLQLTPYLPSGGHPFWAWTSTLEAITLDKDATYRELLKLAALGSVFIVGMIIGADDRRALLYIKMTLVVGVIFTLWAFFVYTADARSAPNGYVQGYLRLHASFQSANNAATVMGILAILALASLIRSVKEITHKTSSSAQFIERFIIRSPIAFIALLLSLIALILTASRGGIAASLVAMLVFIGWELSGRKSRRGNTKNSIGILLLAMALFILAFMTSGDLFLDRLSAEKWINVERNSIYVAHWQAILAAPWTGYGMGSFYLVNDTLLNTENWRSLHATGALHNVYLQWLEEAGIIGAILMWATLVLIFRAIFTGLKHRRRMRTWIRAILSITLLILAHGMVDYGLQVPSIALGWSMLLGMGFGLGAERPS